MDNLKIGLASVTFRNKTVPEIVEIVKKAGVDFIEWGADVHVKSIDDAKPAKKLCDENGITISSYGSYYRTGCGDEAKWEDVCRIAYELGASSVRIWLGNKDSENFSAEEYENLKKEMKFICEKAEEYNLLVCPECHDNTFNNNTDSILKLKNDLNCKNFRTYFQSRYLRFDYDIDRIERTFDFIENFHVSYRDLKREQRFKKKDRKYLDKLVGKFISMDFCGIVIVEFTKGSKEKNFLKDIKKLRTRHQIKNP